MAVTMKSPTVRHETPPQRLPGRVRALVLVRDQGLAALLVLLVVLFSVWASPYFFTMSTGVSVLNAAAITAIFAAGLGIGVMTGVLDLSVPGTAVLAGVVMAKLIKHGAPVGVAIIAGLAIGVAVGVVNGLIAIKGLDPLIVTIAMLAISSGLALIVAGGYDIGGLSQLEFLGTRHYLGVPAPVWVTLALYGVLTVFLRYTRGGHRLLAVGGNAEGARRVGIRISLYRVSGFAISAVCAAVGGIVSAAYVQIGSPSASVGTIFSALTAVALAGVPFTGGRGSLARVLLGAIVLSTISTGLLLANVQTYWSSVATGVLLLGAVALNMWTTRTSLRLLLVSTSERKPS
jgi:ribose transport system permease protein